MSADYATICVYNESSKITDAQAQAACAAIQQQVTQHFAPIWRATAVIQFAAKDEPLPAGAWKFVLADTCSDADALGYHTDEGTPSAVIDVALCLSDNVAWSSCLSHEVLEAIADPECVRCFDLGNGTALSLEVCDAVEGSKHADGSEYQIDGVVLENFCTPNYFTGGPAPWDYLGILPGGARALTAGGYDVSASLGAWTQTTGQMTRPGKLSARKGSRRAQRGV